MDLSATMKQVQSSAKEERQKKYCCVRGSSALNSRSGTDAFKMCIVRQAQLLPLCCIPHTIAPVHPQQAAHTAALATLLVLSCLSLLLVVAAVLDMF